MEGRGRGLGTESGTVIGRARGNGGSAGSVVGVLQGKRAVGRLSHEDSRRNVSPGICGTYLRLTFTPPFEVRMRIVGPPPPMSVEIERPSRPCTVMGKSTLRPPLFVLASRWAEYPSGIDSLTPPLAVSTSSPCPCQVFPSRSTVIPPLLVRPSTDPPTCDSVTPPLTVRNSTRLLTFLIEMPPLVERRESGVCRGADRR